MENDKLFEFMTKMYNDMQDGFKKVEEKFNGVEERFNGIEDRLTKIEKTVLKIEDEHGKKLEALFDGYKQHTEQLERIEKEVSKHDEYILRRIK